MDSNAENVGQMRYAKRPDGSNWGDFGPNDQLGRLNLLTPEQRLKGAAEIQTGICFCLSLPLDLPGGSKWNPMRRPPALRPTIRNGKPNLGYEMQQDNPRLKDVICDHSATLYTQYSTHWDSLAQIGYLYDVKGNGVPEACFYQGYTSERDLFGKMPQELEANGEFPVVPAKALGIESMAASGVQGRGVLIDLEAHFGRARRAISYDDLQYVLKADNVVVEPGDMVCFHTGFSQMFVEMAGDPDIELLQRSCAELDGRDEALLRWISESGICAIASDNQGVEVYPAPAPASPDGPYSIVPLHELCLFKLGIHLGELWHLSPLARWLRENKRSRFMLTAPPLRLPGAVASPVTPIATV